MKYPEPTVNLHKTGSKTDWSLCSQERQKNKSKNNNERAPHSIIPLKWEKIESSLGLGEIHMNKTGWPTSFHFIESVSGCEANS